MLFHFYFLEVDHRAVGVHHSHAWGALALAGGVKSQAADISANIFTTIHEISTEISANISATIHVISFHVQAHVHSALMKLLSHSKSSMNILAFLSHR